MACRWWWCTLVCQGLVTQGPGLWFRETCGGSQLFNRASVQARRAHGQAVWQEEAAAKLQQALAPVVTVHTPVVIAASCLALLFLCQAGSCES